MAYLFFLITGAAYLAIGWTTSEEIYWIAALVAGAIFCIWGTAIAPPILQLLLEVLIIFAVFSVCIRCLESGSSKHNSPR